MGRTDSPVLLYGRVCRQYVFTNENKEQYISVLGKTYKIAEDKISEGVCEDKTFLEVNKLLEN